MSLDNFSFRCQIDGLFRMIMPEGENFEVVRVAMPHSVLDVGQRVNLFEEVLVPEICQGVRNVIIFEQAAGLSFSEAVDISADISRRGSILEAIVAQQLGANFKPRTVDSFILKALMRPPRKEHDLSDYWLLFFDWLVANFDDDKFSLDLFPESCSSEEIAALTKTATDRVHSTARIRPGISLAEFLSGFRTEMRPMLDSIPRRDREIGHFIESELLFGVSDNCRTKVFIVMGPGHDAYRDGMSPESLCNLDYRSIGFKKSLEGEDFDNVLADEAISQESAARIICFKAVVKIVKELFLELYADTLLKEPAKNLSGRTVFDELCAMCMDIPIDVIYAFLQRAAAIGCGLSDDAALAVEFPPILNAIVNRDTSFVAGFIRSFGVNRLVDSKIGMYMARRGISTFLTMVFGASGNREIRDILVEFVDSLPLDFMRRLEVEIRNFIDSRGLTGFDYLFYLLEVIKRKGGERPIIDRKKLGKLAYFLRNNRVMTDKLFIPIVEGL